MNNVASFFIFRFTPFRISIQANGTKNPVGESKPCATMVGGLRIFDAPFLRGLESQNDGLRVSVNVECILWVDDTPFGLESFGLESPRRLGRLEPPLLKTIRSLK